MTDTYQHFQDWFMTQEDIFLMNLAKEYCEECEAYDKIVCSGVDKHGIAQPVNYYELGLVNKNAKMVWTRVMKKAEQMGFSKQLLRKYIVNYEGFAKLPTKLDKMLWLSTLTQETSGILITAQ